MKLIFKYLFITIAFFTLIKCKKYDEGGFTKLSNKHLFGSNKTGSSKTWKLKKYEVNGIDSTSIIPGSGSVTDYYDKFITFRILSDENNSYSADNSFYDYSVNIDRVYKQLLIGPIRAINNQDSTQCYNVNSNIICVRNIFFPEVDAKNFLWNIIKLKKNEMIVEIQLKNRYKIVLTN
jgi:hypothetical protein